MVGHSGGLSRCASPLFSASGDRRWAQDKSAAPNNNGRPGAGTMADATVAPGGGRKPSPQGACAVPGAQTAGATDGVGVNPRQPLVLCQRRSPLVPRLGTKQRAGELAKKKLLVVYSEEHNEVYR
jgi:hypothetical protein